VSKYSLFQSARTTFDATGDARVVFGPDRAFERWRVTNTAITTSSAAATSFKLYRGLTETPSNLIDLSNFNGNNDVSDSVIDLTPGEKLLGVWTGGTPGANATLTVSGESIR
jgi:hypothetical protein